MSNARGPWYIRFQYASIYAPHVQLFNIVEWLDVASTNNKGKVLNNDSTSQDTVDFVNAYADILVPFFPVTAAYLTWEVFNKPTTPGDSFPIVGGSFTSKVGTNATPGWSKATSITANFKTTLAFPFKVVMLDAGSGDDFDKILVPAAGKQQDLVDFVTDAANPFVGMDNAQPDHFLSFTIDLNDKLRKSYRMA
jgi:hypothetical protein